MIGIRRDPSPREPALAGLTMALFFGTAGAVVLVKLRWETAAYVLWGAGAGLALLHAARPALGRKLYLGFSIALYPIGWTISLVMLLLLYYVVITPAGLLLRGLGRDPLHRRSRPGEGSFWVPRGDPPNEDRYFRQF